MTYKMHRPLSSFSPTAEAVYRGVATGIPDSFLGARGMLLSSLQRYCLSLPRHPEHPKGCCCRVYKGTTSPQTPRTPQGMLLSGLQRYYLSANTRTLRNVTDTWLLSPGPGGAEDYHVLFWYQLDTRRVGVIDYSSLLPPPPPPLFFLGFSYSDITD